MPDNPDTDFAQYGPDELIRDRSGGRLPVTKEDYDIDRELFPVPYEIIAERTGEPVPDYLMKTYYDPEDGVHLKSVASAKVTRVCKRYYPERIIRDMKNLYDCAEQYFVDWWSHLEDDQSAEVNEKAAKLVYIKWFMEGYWLKVHELDEEHPENLEAYHRLMEEFIVSARKRAAKGRPRYDDWDYGGNPRWKQNVAATGRNEGGEAVDEDLEIGMGFQGGKRLEELALDRFTKFWNALVRTFYFEEQIGFDYVTLRTIYTHNFIKTYAEKSGNEKVSPDVQQTTARVVTTKLAEDARVYLLEINDPQHLAEPVQVEIAVKNENDVEMRRETNDAG